MLLSAIDAGTSELYYVSILQLFENLHLPRVGSHWLLAAQALCVPLRKYVLATWRSPGARVIHPLLLLLFPMSDPGATGTGPSFHGEPQSQRRRWEGGDSHQHTPNFRNCSGQAGCVYLVPFCVFVIFPSSVSFLLMRVKRTSYLV